MNRHLGHPWDMHGGNLSGQPVFTVQTVLADLVEHVLITRGWCGVAKSLVEHTYVRSVQLDSMPQKRNQWSARFPSEFDLV